jgi:fumarate reductase flavoprotein subunit
MMMGVPATSGLNRIFINNEGKRFVAEDARRDVMVNAIYAQPGGTMWIIADTNKHPEGDIAIENAVKLGKTFKADTVEELADIIGVDAANLQKSIDDYNAVVDGGVDELGLTTYDKKLGNPPYYAAKRLPTVHHTMGGLKIDTECRVLGQDDTPISGLYAAGEVTGDIHGANRLGGNAIVDIAVFGRIAGESVALEK